ncbi:MAG: manganese efflux pump MntP family protein [Christensenellales bacterium]
MLAVGLSMDAFAAALCRGMQVRRGVRREALVTALFFGGFQALMPLIGWLLGSRFQHHTLRFDHWIAFFMLGIIGANMIFQSVKGGQDKKANVMDFDYKGLFVLAVATSIDALAAGMTFALLQVGILPTVLTIGMTTFVITFFGVVAGRRIGALLQKKAEIAGGVILILIGLKILLDHLGAI